LLFASEQGWPFPACCDDTRRGRNICYAHALSSLLPQMVAVTHNYFQDNPNGSEQGGQDYGLIPGNVSSDLSNGPGHPTFDAYNSTAPDVWEQSNDHYCCRHWSMGCLRKSLHGVFDPIVVANGSLQLHGWAWDESAAGAGSSPISVRVSVDGTAVATLVANVSRADLIASGSAPTMYHGFLAEVPSPPADGKVHTVAVHALPVTEGVAAWELTQSPRCVNGTQTVPCTGDSLDLGHAMRI